MRFAAGDVLLVLSICFSSIEAFTYSVSMHMRMPCPAHMHAHWRTVSIALPRLFFVLMGHGEHTAEAAEH